MEALCFLVGMPLIPLALYAAAYNGIQSARSHWVSPAFRRHQQEVQRTPPDPAVVDAVNGFGFRLLRQAANARPGENLFISPSALASTLVLTANGAVGDTREEILKVLGLNASGLVPANESFRRIGAMLNYADPKVQISSTQSLWLDDPAAVLPNFLQTAREDFGADVETLDLQSPDAPGRVNGWLRDHTGGLLSGADAFAPLDRLAFVDSFYFHGEWTTKFKKEDTAPGLFHLRDGSDTTVDMMYGKTGSASFSEPGEEAVRIPYGTGALSMYIFMPRSVDGLPAWLDALTSKRWTELLGDFHEEDVGVGMPRFRVESEPPVKEALQSMGMRRAFLEEGSDFSNISREPLWISSIRHKTLLDVDENGTTAAAMVVEVVTVRGRLPSIRVDQPFFLAIRDDRTKLVLFAGVVYDPSRGSRS
jgi:serpin B